MTCVTLPCASLTNSKAAVVAVDMNVVMTGSNKLIEVQATAEQHPFDDAQLRKMLDIARAGITDLVVRQKAILKGLTLKQ